MSKLLCLIGVMGSGKDYRAKQFIKDSETFGYSMVHVNFADELREMMWDLLNWKPKNDEEYEYFKKGSIVDLGYAERLFDPYVYSISLTGRQLLQRMGTEVIRKRDPYFFVNQWKNKVDSLLCENKNVVCSDLRFINELKAAFNVAGNTKTKKEFIFCNYISDRYDATNTHESEQLAQRILSDNYKDGELIDISYLLSLVSKNKG